MLNFFGLVVELQRFLFSFFPFLPSKPLSPIEGHEVHREEAVLERGLRPVTGGALVCHPQVDLHVAVALLLQRVSELPHRLPLHDDLLPVDPGPVEHRDVPRPEGYLELLESPLQGHLVLREEHGYPAEVARAHLRPVLTVDGAEGTPEHSAPEVHAGKLHQELPLCSILIRLGKAFRVFRAGELRFLWGALGLQDDAAQTATDTKLGRWA